MNFKICAAVGFFLLGMQGCVQADEIAKCQDEQGNWHYGNYAASECAKSSEITRLNDSGAEVGKVAPPPTKEEFAAEMKAKREAEKDAKEQRQQQLQDRNIVQIYGSEDFILFTRDRKLSSIDNNLEVARQLKKGILTDIAHLKDKKQTEKVKSLIEERETAVRSYDEVIMKSLFERNKLEAEYAEILKTFRAASSRLEGGG